jgi:hypothetical protein
MGYFCQLHKIDFLVWMVAIKDFSSLESEILGGTSQLVTRQERQFCTGGLQRLLNGRPADDNASTGAGTYSMGKY